MTIDFQSTRGGEGPVLASLSEEAVEGLNDTLRQKGLSITIDPYGDTKILDTDICEILALPSGDLDIETRSAIEKLRDMEVVYAIGD